MSTDKDRFVQSAGLLLLGFWIGILFLGIQLRDQVSPTTVIVYEKLRRANVPIALSENGEFWVWNEATKSSFKITQSDMTSLAKRIK